MEKQRFCKPYLARFWLYRWFVGGTWRKYGYTIYSNELEGWYWTKENINCNGSCQLKLLKTKEY